MQELTPKCSTVSSMARQPHANALRPADCVQGSRGSGGSQPPPLALLLLIFTQRANEERRNWQRTTFLGRSWQAGEAAADPTAKDSTASSWRYVYVLGREQPGAKKGGGLGRLVGDSVMLSAVSDSYPNLVYKTLESLRWVIRRVPCEVMLKTDDDTIVHVGRALRWLAQLAPPSRAHWRAQVYAGRVFNDSQIIRPNFTRKDLLNPSWFPDDFLKWSAPYEAVAGVGGIWYPPYCSGGGYLLGVAAARRLVARHDERIRRGLPVVRVEDAYVGILASEATRPRVRPTDISHLVQDPPVGRPQLPALFAAQILVHRVGGGGGGVAAPAQAFEWLLYNHEREKGLKRAHR